MGAQYLRFPLRMIKNPSLQTGAGQIIDFYVSPTARSFPFFISKFAVFPAPVFLNIFNHKFECRTPSESDFYLLLDDFFLLRLDVSVS